MVKDLERRGFLKRARDPNNERQLSIVLSAAGAQRVATDTVLDPQRLAKALRTLPPAERRALLAGLEDLARASESVTAE